MVDLLGASLKIASSGIQAQSARLKVISENISNASSTGSTPGADPFARKTITFESEMSRAEGMRLTRVKNIGVDETPFPIEHQPGHPAADINGNVKMPNVNILIETADMRDATRAYEANLQVVKQSRELLSMTLDLLKGTS
ncbi:MAG: flagellar basal-body rod protein FlgC [Hyphomicrobiales bacterium]|jgi:flagellar basal-body rod protein FlgC|nr:flagellar basal-body rod protein FlgC [Hyphomicrobiales bacterium]